MNVLHVDEQRTWRGGEQQAAWFIRALAKGGHRVVLAGRPGSAFLQGDYGDGGIERMAAPFLGEFDMWTALKLARLVRSHGIDILHAQTSHAHTYVCLARALAGRGKVVVTRRVSFAPKSNWLNRWKYRMPDCIVAVSEHVADVLRDFGVGESRLAVVPSALDPARVNVPPIPRSDLGCPDGAPLVGTAGALVGHKDHATLLASIPFALRQFPDLRVVIAGEGPLRASLEKQIAELGLGPCVTLLGHREDAPAMIRALDVYVSSSWSEGLGTSVLEALAAEVPVVATVAGGVPEMVRHEETGLLAPPRDPEALANAIVRALQDRTFAREMARNGKALVLDQYSVDRMIEGNLRVYERLLAR